MTTTTAANGLTGISGFFADLIAAAGEVGVGLLTSVETVVPPIPSEVVLPLAGFLARIPLSLRAGAQRMPLLAFTLLTALGSAAWNALLVGAGYAFATQRDAVGSWASAASNVVLVVLVVVFLGVLVRRALQRRADGAGPLGNRSTAR